MTKKPKAPALFDGAIIAQAIVDSFRKLNPQASRPQSGDLCDRRWLQPW